MPCKHDIHLRLRLDVASLELEDGNRLRVPCASRHRQPAFVHGLATCPGNWPRLDLDAPPWDEQRMALLPLLDRIAQSSVGNEVLGGEGSPGEGALVVGLEPALDGGSLVGHAVAGEDRIAHRREGDRAEEGGKGCRLACHGGGS
eukprot:548586-Hanusia_phi.AAC.1